jgi:hypothetical protein
MGFGNRQHVKFMVSKGRQNSLRRGRASIGGHVYSVTTATIGRAAFFLDFQAGCAARRAALKTDGY